MASRLPIVRQIAWLSILPQLAIMGAVVGGALSIGGRPAVPVALLGYMALAFGLRHLVARDHRQGVDRFRRKEFAEAIGYFEKSYAFFTQRRWIDDWRYVTLFSSSRISYREMALLNIAFCAAQLGDGSMARDYYERTLKEFPDSEMAKSSLRMLNSR